MKKDLVRLRKDIDEIDQEIYHLIENRFLIVKEIIKYKKENNLEALDERREKIMLDKLNKQNIDEEIKPYLISYLKNMLLLSKEYQNSYLKKEK